MITYKILKNPSAVIAAEGSQYSGSSSSAHSKKRATTTNLLNMIDAPSSKRRKQREPDEETSASSNSTTPNLPQNPPKRVESNILSREERLKLYARLVGGGGVRSPLQTIFSNNTVSKNILFYIFITISSTQID
jgi:hypothetical protein